MKIRHLILGGLAVAAMSFAGTGCNENPITTPPGDGTGPTAPSGLQATSLSATSVGLKWVASTDTGSISYTVAWRASDGTDSGSVPSLTTVAYTVNNLSASKGYVFSVYAVRSSAKSSAATLTWAGAPRYGTTTTIRMYESLSSQGSGLTLDPSLGGPVNARVAASNPNPERVQLAIYTKGSDPNTFSIGAAYAFIEYRAVAGFDQNTFISTSSYPAQSLNEWYSAASIDGMIPSDGNSRAFELPISQTGGAGQGFYVRTGTTGNYHYARVFVKNAGGKLLQGSAPERYVELEISYQQTANLPYAKTGYVTPANLTSTTGH